MVLLLCLAFVGQALSATVMPYQMMSMKGMSTQDQSHDMSKMDHSGHSMTNDIVSNETIKSADDCCKKNCSCLTGGCSNVAVLIKDTCNSPTVDFYPKISSVSSLAQSQLLTSLYRPPIKS